MTNCALENEFQEQKERLSRAIIFALTDDEKMKQKKEGKCPLEKEFLEIYSSKKPAENKNQNIYTKHIQYCPRCFYVSNLLFWFCEYLKHISQKYPRLYLPEYYDKIMMNILKHISQTK